MNLDTITPNSVSTSGITAYWPLLLVGICGLILVLIALFSLLLIMRRTTFQESGRRSTTSDSIQNGLSDGSNPGRAATRQQMVTILYRYAGLRDYKVGGRGDLNAFPDAGAVSAYAKDAMAWSVANNIVGGTTQGTLDPVGTASRAQFAAILYRFHMKMD